MKNILVSWIGNTDLVSIESEDGTGPVEQAVDDRDFDEIVLLCNYKKERWELYNKWFNKKFPNKKMTIYNVSLSSPTNYSEIYETVVKILENILKDINNPNLTFHLSPGTPAMSAVWIIVAASRFPANLIESSKEAGLKDVDFPFEISADYIPKLNKKVESRIIDFSESLPPDTPEFEMIIHKSKIMKKVIVMAKRAAVFDIPILLMGESGTGKELFARAAWSQSERSKGPFIPVNCGAIPESLAESELFGHVKGAFTGADSNRIGKIESAHGGILFLDEIGELSKDIQVKLLRVIQEKEVFRLGSSKPVKVDFRVFAATNRDLLKDTANGVFRQDLFHRIAIAVIKLPAIRERSEDLTLLTDYFLTEINEEFYNQKGWINKSMSSSGRKVIKAYSWPGNVRELVNTLMRVALWCDGSIITSKDIESALLGTNESKISVLEKSLGNGFDLEELLGEVAVSYMGRAMEETRGNKSLAADLLGFKNYQTLSNWLKRYGMD